MVVSRAPTDNNSNQPAGSCSRCPMDKLLLLRPDTAAKRNTTPLRGETKISREEFPQNSLLAGDLRRRGRRCPSVLPTRNSSPRPCRNAARTICGMFAPPLVLPLPTAGADHRQQTRQWTTAGVDQVRRSGQHCSLSRKAYPRPESGRRTCSARPPPPPRCRWQIFMGPPRG